MEAGSLGLDMRSGIPDDVDALWDRLSTDPGHRWRPTVAQGGGFLPSLAGASAGFGTPANGHGGVHVGYAAWAGCLPDRATVIVVLTNDETADPMRIAADLEAAANAR